MCTGLAELRSDHCDPAFAAILCTLLVQPLRRGTWCALVQMPTILNESGTGQDARNVADKLIPVTRSDFHREGSSPFVLATGRIGRAAHDWPDWPRGSCERKKRPQRHIIFCLWQWTHGGRLSQTAVTFLNRSLKTPNRKTAAAGGIKHKVV